MAKERMFTVELTASKTYYKKERMEIEAASIAEAKEKVQNMTISEFEDLDWTIYDAGDLTRTALSQATGPE